jgi:hypothetical protein
MSLAWRPDLARKPSPASGRAILEAVFGVGSASADLQDGIESLEYWRERSRRLSWYRFRARREARVMAQRWERRVRCALFSQRGVPFETRVSAGMLVVGLRLQRMRSRLKALLVTTAVASIAVLVTLPAIVDRLI